MNEINDQKQVEKLKTRRLIKFLRNHGWMMAPRNGLRHRCYSLVSARYRWWDWGHWLMILVGRDEGGNWSEPRPQTWWYRQGLAKTQRITKYPKHPLSTYEVIKSYDEFRTYTKGLSEDALYEWQALNVNQDGDLHLGHQYWGQQFYGLTKSDVKLLRKYLRAWNRLDWWGLRSWLFEHALHAAVYQRRPGACNQPPPSGQGGYTHWLCTLRRKHDGMHRYNNYTWGDIGGFEIGAVHNPEIKE
jgi:hypothetical protein